MTAPPADAPARRSNLGALGLSQGFRMASGVAINIMLMRVLGVEGFGVYGYVMTLVGVCAFGAHLGMAKLVKRELARAPEHTAHYVAAGMLALVVSSTVTATVIVGWAWLLDGRALVVVASALAAVALGLQSVATIPVAAFHGMRRMDLAVPGHVFGRVVLVAATAVFLYLRLGIASVFVAQVADGVATMAVVAWFYRRHVGRPDFARGRHTARPLARQAVPFGLNALFSAIYLSVDVILLEHLAGDAEVGIYRGAVMLIAMMPIFAETLSTGIFPRMAKHLGDPDAAGRELGFALRVLLALSVPAAVGGFILAEPLMVLLGGQPFAASALPFMVMAPLLPLRFVKNALGMTLSTLNRQAVRTRAVLFAAIFNLVANFIAIPEYGAVGAAGTTVLTEILLTAYIWVYVRPLVRGLDLARSLVRTVVPAAVMGAALLAVPQLQVLVMVALGAVVYGAVGRLSGAWHPNDFGRLRRV